MTTTPSNSRSQLVQDLTQRLRQVERAWRRPEEERDGTDEAISSGIPALDGLLAPEGLHRGSLVECLVPEAGSGAETLVLTVAAHLMKPRGALVVMDNRREFYPPAAAALGIELERTIVVRPHADVLWAVEQSLRCRGVAAVLCEVGRVSEHVFRRWQLAAEVGNSIGLLLRPAQVRSQPSWAAVRLGVQSAWRAEWVNADVLHGRRLQIELLYGRGGVRSGAVELELSDETGRVCLAPELAAATSARRAAGA